MGERKRNLRARRVAAEVVMKTYGRATDPDAVNTNDLEQWFDENAGSDRMVARLGGGGSLYHKLNDRTAWTAINIDSPTVAGRFTAYSQDANGGAPNCRVVENGGRAEISGAINVTAATGTDEVIATSMPTGLTLLGMGGTVSAVPARRRHLAAGSQATGAQRVRVTSAGALQIVGTIGAATTLYLDGLSYRLD